MRTRLVITLGSLLLVEACRSTPVAPVRRTTASAAPSVAVSAATPTPKPTATAASTAAPATTLKPPTAAFVELSGVVLADPAYLVASGGAKLVSNNGGSVLALGEAGLLGNDGSNRVAGTVGGAAALGDAGSFLAAGNAGLISNNGGSLVSNNGGGLVSDHGAAYHLMADATPALLPAGGFTVSAVSLRTRTYVPIGRDDTGKPVYTIYSDAAGRYKLYVDGSEGTNVVVVADVPQRHDVVFNAIAPAAGGTVQVGDDASNGTRLAREILANQLAAILTAQDVDAALAAIGNSADFLTPTTRPMLSALVTALDAAARAHHVPTGAGAQDIPEVQALSTLLAERILADLPYDQLHLGPLFAPTWKGSPDQAYDALEGVMGTLRETAGRYFAAQTAAPPYEIDFPRFVQLGAPTNLCTYQERLKLQRPVDACTYLVDDLLARSQGKLLSNTQAVFAALATHDTPGVKQLDQLQPGDPEYYLDPGTHQPQAASLRLNAALDSLLGAFALALAPDAEGKPTPELTALVQALGAYADAHAFTGTPSPRPALGLGVPCVPTPTPQPSRMDSSTSSANGTDM